MITAESIRSWAGVVRQTPWAPALLVMAYVPAAVVLFPRPILTELGVLAFGMWPGITYAVAGVLLAALAGYGAGRFLPEHRVRRFAGKELEPAIEVMRDHGIAAVFALNMIPTPPFIVECVVAGAIRINLLQYVIGHLLGMAPSVAAWAVFGSQMIAALDDPSKVSWPAIAGAVGALVAFTFLVRRWFQKRVASRPRPA